MAYDEQSFLNGLAAGLSVTGGQLLGGEGWQLMAGTTRMGAYQWPEGNFDTFVFKNRFKEGFINGYTVDVRWERGYGQMSVNGRLVDMFSVEWKSSNAILLGTHRTSSLEMKYEYGPIGSEYQTEFSRIQSQTGGITVYHVIRSLEAAPMSQFHCDAFFSEPEGVLTAFDSYFAAFPYRVGNREFLYPGSPEQVNVWLSRTFRGFDL